MSESNDSKAKGAKTIMPLDSYVVIVSEKIEELEIQVAEGLAGDEYKLYGPLVVALDGDGKLMYHQVLVSREL